MILCVTPEDREKRREPGNKVELFGDRAVPWDGPCGHLVTQGPDVANPAHFHEADQFQIFVAGSGRIGNHRVKVGTIHYADGYRGYGPIVPDQGGCSYLSLRPTYDTSRHLIPQEAELARGRKGGQRMAEFDLSADVSPGVTTLLYRNDGVGAYQQNMDANQPLPMVETKGGSYWLVLKGSIRCDGRDCPTETCIWVGEGEARPEMIAGSDGATVIVMCFAVLQSQQERKAKTN
jgi:hypothetical protein